MTALHRKLVRANALGLPKPAALLLASPAVVRAASLMPIKISPLVPITDLDNVCMSHALFNALAGMQGMLISPLADAALEAAVRQVVAQRWPGAAFTSETISTLTDDRKFGYIVKMKSLQRHIVFNVGLS